MTLRIRHLSFVALALPLFAALGCDGPPDTHMVLPAPDLLVPGSACLVASTDSLDFGSVLAGNQKTFFVTVAGCDDAAVTLHTLGVPDDGDMLLQSRVYRADGSAITPLLPYALQPDEDLVVAVTYRARASARDLSVSRTLRFEADSRVVPELPGRFEVDLVAQPVTACGDDECGGPAEASTLWPVATTTEINRDNNSTGSAVPLDKR